MADQVASIPHAEQTDRSLAMLENRLGQTIGMLERLKSIGRRVYTSLLLDELAPVEVPNLVTQLLQARVPIAQWKESFAHAGAGTSLALVQGHLPCAKGLTSVKKVPPLNDEGKQVEIDEYLPKFQYAASRVATFIDLENFVEETVDDAEVEDEED